MKTNINIQKYPAYKASGVEWLGDVPEHWEAVSLGSLMELKSDKNHPDYEVLSVYREYGVIKKDSRDDNHNATSLDTSNYKAVEPGDLVVNKMKTWQGSMGISPYKGIVSPAYITCKITSKEVVSEYLHRLLRSNLYIGEYNRISYGVRVGQWDMHFEDFKRVTVLVPPLAEQTAIAIFLDTKTVQIDKAIAIKVKQIELLKERRQILIHRAVTRGLDPHVKLKDSGVEWIGEIPESWEVKRLRYLADCFPSNVDKHSKENEIKVRLCNYTDVYKNDFITDDMDLMIATATNDQIRKFTLKKGDVVITKDSEAASDIAVPAYVTENLTNVICGYHLAVIRPNQGIDGKYLFRAFQCKVFNAQFEVCSNGITRVGLGNSDLKKGQFSVPPFNEQLAISEYIETSNTKLSIAISIKEKEIEKLKEYKSVLIDSVVRGKVRVG
ncbi:MAG: restriction endonuclease subunit S [Paludibacter sp.]|nr:restriction endonuclease subunit S [Paludibacter sp.]